MTDETAAAAPSRRPVRPFGRLGRGLVQFALPPSCLACGVPVADDGSLCATCWADLRLIERPFCERLAVPFPFDMGEGALSPEAIADPPPFDRLRAVAVFDHVARQLVHSLKYHDRLDLSRWMAGWMARAGRDVLAEAGVIVPVPLHRLRLWVRKFNQAAALGGALARAADKPFAPMALQRVRSTRRQVGLKPEERAENVKGAFRVPDGRRAEVAGRRVLLVDDVYTTGATAKAAARALLRAGAAGVDVLAFARVVKS